MPLTLPDVQDATIEADNRFIARTCGSFWIYLTVGQVKITNGSCGYPNDYGRGWWNYDIPSKYKMPRSFIGPLQTWWEDRHPNTGVVLHPQWKYGNWIINIQWTTEHDRIFNMHVAVIM